MPSQISILMIEDSEDDALLLEAYLERYGYEFQCKRVYQADAMKAALCEKQWHIILSDFSLPQFSGLDALKILKDSGLDIPFIIVSGMIDEETAVTAMRSGACDYVLKNNLPRLGPALERELREAESRAAKKRSEALYQTLYQWEKRTREAVQQFQHPMESEEIFKLCLALMGEILELDRCVAFEVEQGRILPIRYEYLKNNTIQSWMGERSSWDSCPMLKYLRLEKKTLAIEDIRREEIISSDERTFFEERGIRGWMGIPIVDQDQFLGIVVLHMAQPRSWMQQEISFASTLLEQVKVSLYQTRALQKEQQANRRKSEFLAMMSHELRTPLNSILGYTKMMRLGMIGPVNEKQSEYLNNVFVSGEHLLNIVNDLLDVSKIESGKMTLQPEFFQLNPVLEEVKAMMSGLAAKKDISLIFDISPQLDWIDADPARFKQILINLLGNAIKFNREGGIVCLHLKLSDGPIDSQLESQQQWLIGSVEDTGIGIPLSKQDELFQKFYQLDNSASRKHEGSGLGLVLTREFVERHGGHITVQSEEGLGTTFSFTLPVHTTKMRYETHEQYHLNH